MRKLVPSFMLCAFLFPAPAEARPDLRLLDSDLAGPSPMPLVRAAWPLRLQDSAPSGQRLRLAVAADPSGQQSAHQAKQPSGPAPAASATTPPSSTPTPAAPAPGPSLDFDLLPPPPAPPGENPALARRRTLLDWHQGLGIGLLGLTLATAVVGQLNYDDRFVGSRPSTGDYLAPHAVLATSTLVLFAATGTLALLAPAPPERRDGFDRITLHEIAMFTAAAGMAAEGALGLWTQQREGYFNQESIARAHLVLGYVVVAAVATGVAAIVF